MKDTRPISIAVFLIVLFVSAMFLSGCVYSSANMVRAQGKKITVLCPAAYVNCIDSTVTLYRSTDAIAYPKNPKQAYPKIPTRPTISEESEASSFNAGKATKLNQKDATPMPDDSPLAAVAQAVLTK